MPSNPPYTSGSNPTGAVPVRTAATAPTGATLPRFVQTNPFDTNNNGVVDRVDEQPMANVTGLLAALAQLQSNIDAKSFPVTLPKLGINCFPTNNGFKVAAPGGLNNPFSVIVATPEGYERVWLGTKSDGSGVVTVLNNDGDQVVVLNAQTGQVLVNGNPVPTLVNGVLPPSNLASGSALQVLRRNANNSALEFATLAAGAVPFQVRTTFAIGGSTFTLDNVRYACAITPNSVGGSTTQFVLDTDLVWGTEQFFRNGILLKSSFIGGASHDYTPGIQGAFTLASALGGSEKLVCYYLRGHAQQG